jgi:hypothetical protein
VIRLSRVDRAATWFQWPCFGVSFNQWVMVADELQDMLLLLCEVVEMTVCLAGWEPTVAAEAWQLFLGMLETGFV